MAGAVGLTPFVRIRGVDGGARPFGRVLLVDPVPLRAAGADADDEIDDPVVDVGPARCGEEDEASSPTRRRLLSALGFSVTIFMVGRGAADPKLGD